MDNQDQPESMSSYISNWLKSFARWKYIENYLIYEKIYIPSSNEFIARKISKYLLNSDTFIICCLLYLRSKNTEKNYFTLRELSKSIDGRTEDCIKAAEGKIKRLLKNIKDCNVIYSEKTTHVGNRDCIRISASSNLIYFFENIYLNSDKEKQYGNAN